MNECIRTRFGLPPSKETRARTADFSIVDLDHFLDDLSKKLTEEKCQGYIDDSEYWKLHEAPAKIINGWRILREHIASLRGDDLENYAQVVGSVKELVDGLAWGVYIGTTSKSTLRNVRGRPLAIGRRKKAEKNSPESTQINDAIMKALKKIEPKNRATSLTVLAGSIIKEVNSELAQSGLSISSSAVRVRLENLIEAGEIIEVDVIDKSKRRSRKK